MNGFWLKEFLISGSKHVSVLTAAIDNPGTCIYGARCSVFGDFNMYVVPINEFDSEIHECFIGIISIQETLVALQFVAFKKGLVFFLVICP